MIRSFARCISVLTYQTPSIESVQQEYTKHAIPSREGRGGLRHRRRKWEIALLSLTVVDIGYFKLSKSFHILTLYFPFLTLFLNSVLVTIHLYYEWAFFT